MKKLIFLLLLLSSVLPNVFYATDIPPMMPNKFVSPQEIGVWKNIFRDIYATKQDEKHKILKSTSTAALINEGSIVLVNYGAIHRLYTKTDEGTLRYVDLIATGGSTDYMAIQVYDTDYDNVVDNSELLDGYNYDWFLSTTIATSTYLTQSSATVTYLQPTGDGSGLSGINDIFWNHVATTTVNMNSNEISNCAGINVQDTKYYKYNGLDFLKGTGLSVYLGYGLDCAGGYNTVVGHHIGGGANFTGNENVLVGYYTANDLTTGTKNTAIGRGSLWAKTSGSNNTVVGYKSLYSNNNSGCVALGYEAGYNNSNDNRLYIDNSNDSTPLIWGDFANDYVVIYDTLCVNTSTRNGALNVNGDAWIAYDLTVDDDITADGITASTYTCSSDNTVITSTSTFDYASNDTTYTGSNTFSYTVNISSDITFDDGTTLNSYPGLWEIDIAGGLMPVNETRVDAKWEISGNDLQPSN